MPRSWLVDSRGFAKKVKGGTLPYVKQLKDCGAKHECLNCHYLIDNSDGTDEWPGLPVGVKFDPSDVEILEHLAAKCGEGNSKPHMLIDEFIHTIDAEGGICHKHPEDLPGSRKDGNSVHLFHINSNAYTKGQRKRRKIHNGTNSTKEEVRWHKTGTTKAVTRNGVQKGCKKIMVLHSASVKGSKPEKTNWVMHQYHLGTDENEKEGQYVVSKIFYQAQKAEKNYRNNMIDESDVGMIRNIPRTPNTPTLDPPPPVKSGLCGDVTDDCAILSPVQESEFIKNTSHPPPSHPKNKDMEYPFCLAGESQAMGLIEEGLLCDEIFNSIASSEYANLDTACGFSDLDSLELDTPPDFHLSDIDQIGSQDSIFGW